MSCSAAQIGEGDQQTGNGILGLDRLARGILEIGQIALLARRDFGNLAIGSGHGHQLTLRVADKGGEIIAAVGDAEQITGTVVGEAEQRRTIQRVTGFDMHAVAVELINLQTVLRSDQIAGH